MGLDVDHLFSIPCSLGLVFFLPKRATMKRRQQTEEVHELCTL